MQFWKEQWCKKLFARFTPLRAGLSPQCAKTARLGNPHGNIFSAAFTARLKLLVRIT
jgi:hypothetical protein